MVNPIPRGRTLPVAIAIVFMVAAGLIFNSMSASTAPAVQHRVIKGAAHAPVGFAVSQPLSAIAERAAKAGAPAWPTPTGVDPFPMKPFLGGMQIPRQVTPKGSAASGRPTIEPKARLIDPPSPGLDISWAGLSQGVNRVWYGYGVYPPDTQGDVGPAHYIQVVNMQVAVFDMTQGSLVGTPRALYVGPINSLWEGSGLSACEASEDGDPVVVYDEYADRWVLSQFALTNYPNAPFYECIAVSQTGDPMGAWNLYQYSFPVMNDYPKFSVWHDGYYMTMNQFRPWTSPQWAGQGVVVFDKVAMQEGEPDAQMIYIDTYASCTGTEPECYLGGMLAADADGTTPPTGPEIFMQFDDDAWGYSPDQLQLWTLVPDWDAGTAEFSHLMDLGTTAFDSEVCQNYSRNCIPQNGTSQGLDAITDRLMYRLQWRDFGTYQAMVVNHTVDVVNAPSTVKGQAGVRWYELRDTGSGWGIFQEGDIAPDTKNRWMGSAAMDDVDNISVGYSVSDATIYPGIRFATHLVSDPPGTMRSETSMVTGGGAQTGSGARWGDYSMLSVYPAGSGGCDFIYTQEYLRGTTSAEWYTWIGLFHNPSCYTGDVTPPDTSITGTGSAGPGSTTAEFTFTGTDDVAVASYECALDGSAFATCTSPKSYTGLGNGSHTFEVRAVDSSKNYDSTPASYTWTIEINSATFVSQAPYDGFIIESREDSDAGGRAVALGSIAIGDNQFDHQLKGVLSFDTSGLPDGAVVLGARIEMLEQKVVGTNPYGTHGALVVDIASPFFGANIGLRSNDFQAAAGSPNVATCDPTPDAGWYHCDVGDGLSFVSLTATTQFRLGFATDDNDNRKADQIKFYSGNAGDVAKRPVLVVNYYMP